MRPITDIAVLSNRYRLIEDWNALTPDRAERVRAFWRDEGAITDEAAMERRLPEIVVHAEDADGNIAAVSTAYPAAVPHMGEAFFHFRCFVGKEHRGSLLMRQITIAALHVLERHAIETGSKCVGVLAELENPRFQSAMSRLPVWRGGNVQLTYIGRSPRGLGVRVYYFHGARLTVRPREGRG